MNVQQRVALWKAQALHDWEAAQRNHEIGLYDYALLACQQATEKLLKALFLKQTGREPPWVHHLEDLLGRVGLRDELFDSVLELDDYYFVLRYPGISDEMAPFELCTPEDAELGLENTRRVLGVILPLLEWPEEESDGEQS